MDNIQIAEVRGCVACGETFPLTRENFRSNRHGFVRKCKRCQKMRPRVAWVDRTCVACGAKLSVPAAWAKRGEGCFCNKRCQSKARKAHSERSAAIAARFWGKVDKQGPVIHPELGECWIWTAYRTRAGYGCIGLNGRRELAPRVSWLIHTGARPTKLVCHHCDNPSCVRFSHLFEGTVADNNNDRDAKGRRVTRPLPGERNPAAKLTEAQVRRIRSAVAMGASRAQFAREYGVSRECIYAVCDRLTWTHIP